MREFKLLNATGAEFDLMQTTAFLWNPDGLGWGFETSVADVGGAYIPLDTVYTRPAPSGTMVFAGYSDYEGFLTFVQAGGLVLGYKPLNTWKYLDVSVIIGKSEIKPATNRLQCDISFAGLSHWYEANAIYNAEPVTVDGPNLFSSDLFQQSSTTVVLGSTVGNSDAGSQYALTAGTYTIEYESTQTGSIYYDGGTLGGSVRIAQNAQSATFTIAGSGNYAFWVYRSGGMASANITAFTLKKQETVSRADFNNGALESYCKITIDGAAENPVWTLYDSADNVISSGAITATIPAGDTLIINSRPRSMELAEYDGGGDLVANRYSDSDFDTERFIVIPPGTGYYMTFADDNGNLTATVEVFKRV